MKAEGLKYREIHERLKEKGYTGTQDAIRGFISKERRIHRDLLDTGVGMSELIDKRRLIRMLYLPPSGFKTDLQEKTYHALDGLHIPFERVDTDEAITMDDCTQIDEKLNMKMVKTLFLCNRQQTAFYLFITAGDKPFRAKGFSNALEVARVSFAPADLMEKMLATKIRLPVSPAA
ncbi:MAG: hypothetical protein LBS32_03215 [Clostridiales Family XIII bacterium]|jgi:hypothetical protein|nr:hypothetical protein [Clostridiales Family XIII bacterium]